MSGKSLSDLDLKDEVLPAQSFDDLPDFGGFQEPPQPGKYLFQLPGLDVLSHAFDVYDQGDRQFIRVIFDRDAPLTIVQSPQGKLNGDTFHTRLSNQERKRGNVEASDFSYLLKALGEKQKPTSNRGFIEALQRHAGEKFSAEITYSFVCSPDREIYVTGADGRQQKVEGKYGCAVKGGKSGRYYQKDIEKLRVDGVWPTSITCACGAVLRAFSNLENLRA